MRSICLAILLAGASALKLEDTEVSDHASKLKQAPTGLTFRQWMLSQKCINMASLPLMNTQFAQLGAIDALESEGLMDRITGLSGVSSGAFITALAAMHNRSEASALFRSIWPGWMGLGANVDPDFSRLYAQKVLNKVLPKTFADLKIPLAHVAVKYWDDRAAQEIDAKRADPVVISDGNLAESVIVSSSAMMGPGCPKCNSGFQAKTFRGMWPVADGFLKDEYGTLGLSALEPCENLIHIMPQNYPQQLTPTLNANIDTQPTNVVSLGIDVPSSSIMSMMYDAIRHSKPFNFIKNGKLGEAFKLVTGNEFAIPMKAMGANEAPTWEKLQYDVAYQHMKELLDQPMMIGEERNHFFVDLNLIEHWKLIRGKWEEDWDRKNDAAHKDYWVRTISRRNAMVSSRNKKIKDGVLSFRAGGNGLGAPKLILQKLAHEGPKGFSATIGQIPEHGFNTDGVAALKGDALLDAPAVDIPVEQGYWSAQGGNFQTGVEARAQGSDM